MVLVTIVSALFLRYSEFTSLFPSFCHEAAGGDEGPGQDDRWEVIGTTEFIETADSVDSDAVAEADDGRKHLDVQLADEERALFGVDSHELGLLVELGNLVQMHVYDLAPFEVFVEESDNDELRSSDLREELLLGDFVVLTVAVDKVLLLLGLLSFNGGDPHLFLAS